MAWRSAVAERSSELRVSRGGGDSNIRDLSSVGPGRPCHGAERSAYMTQGNRLDGQERRIAVLKDLAILDTPPEDTFDDIVEVAAALCDAPISLVSLVDRDRQWFKARVGLDLPETPIEQSVCALAIRQDDVFVIEDLSHDTRTCASALVTAPDGIRFYAGVPLVTKAGVPIGSLCVIDTAPRPGGISARQAAALQALARQVMAGIEAHHRDVLQAREVRRATRGRDLATARLERSEARTEALVAAEARLRSAQEAGRIGTFEIDIAENVVTMSGESCRLFGIPELQSYPADYLESLMLSDDDTEHSTQADRLNGTSRLDVEYRIRRADTGEVRWLARRAVFVKGEDGDVVRMRGTVHDVTDRRLASERVIALLELGDRLRDLETVADIVAAASSILCETLEVARCGYFTVDIAQGTLSLERDCDSGSLERMEAHYPASSFLATLQHLAQGETRSYSDVEQALELTQDLPSYQALQVRSAIKIPLLTRGELTGILFVHEGTPREWDPLELAFAETVADYVQAAIAKVRAEEERRTVYLELSHRMKNTMTMIHAIAAQTLRGVTERDAVDAFSRRLMAFSAAHDVLLQQSWMEARIDRVVAEVLGKLAVDQSVLVDGPSLTIGPRAVLGLSLLLHELATNAIKYGALSSEGGQVMLRWVCEDTSTNPGFKLMWLEAGGPSVTEPGRKGFGSRLISMGLLGSGQVDLRYAPSGLEAVFEAPLSRMQSE
ncbi:MAG: HWE histidine kinase domain-containing protein [Novosphingobium sp.]